MSRNDLVGLLLIVLGVILFLYGSNYYNALAGWSGLCLIVGGFLAELALGLYSLFWKKKS